MTESDLDFLSRLRSGYTYQEIVVKWLNDAGIPAEIKPLKIRPDAGQAARYADNGDIFIPTQDGEFVFEVKSRNIKFTTPEDYPFYTAFIGQVRHLNSRPFNTVLVSTKTGSALVVPSKTRKFWTQKMIEDDVRGVTYPIYEVPTKYLRTFEEFKTYLKGLNASIQRFSRGTQPHPRRI